MDLYCFAVVETVTSALQFEVAFQPHLLFPRWGCLIMWNTCAEKKKGFTTYPCFYYRQQISQDGPETHLSSFASLFLIIKPFKCLHLWKKSFFRVVCVQSNYMSSRKNSFVSLKMKQTKKVIQWVILFQPAK